MIHYIGIAMGAALIVLSASAGIAKIASKGMETIGRQPEAADKVRSGMLFPLALIEGAAMFGLVICIIMIFSIPTNEEQTPKKEVVEHHISE